ncbi:hypothetical protein M5K25_006936 [Dendrobium thyrsiflorum]|uniref:Reverse transcriptase n=1 Tax=Dendrobium thyrsiflorum TaxID=117978 RepID=A0ABD0VDY0_DENTH
MLEEIPVSNESLCNSNSENLVAVKSQPAVEDKGSGYGPWIHVNYGRKRKLSGNFKGVHKVRAPVVEKKFQQKIKSGNGLEMKDSSVEGSDALRVIYEKEQSIAEHYNEEAVKNLNQDDVGNLNYADQWMKDPYHVAIGNELALNQVIPEEENMFMILDSVDVDENMETKGDMVDSTMSEREDGELVDEVKECGEPPDNVEGINSNVAKGARKMEASRYFKKIVKDYDTIFVGLVETKISSIDSFEFKRFIGDKWDFYLFPTVGLSGGIMVCWRSDMASFSVIEASAQVVGELNIASRGVWLLATVYGSRDCYNRKSLWSRLESLTGRNVPTMTGGDFNCILSQDEKRGDKKFVLSQGPQDMLYFFGVKLNTKNLVDLKENLKEISELQEEEDAEGGLSDQKLLLLKSKVSELNSTLGRLFTCWKQRAKVQWMEDGVSNSKFFHAFATARRNGNWINQVRDGSGLLIEDRQSIKEVFMDFFKNKWRERKYSLGGWPSSSKRLDDVDRRMLEKEFSKDELEIVIKQLGANKSPANKDQLELIFKCSSRSIAALPFEKVYEDYRDDDYWCWIKKLKLRPQIELFWWHLNKNAIPSNWFLHYRRVVEFDGCPRGCEAVENAEHVVQCVKINQVLKRLATWGIFIPVIIFLEDCNMLLRHLANLNPFAGNLYCSVVFFCWKSRNKVIHSGFEDSCSYIASNSISHAVASFRSNLIWENWDANQLCSCFNLLGVPHLLDGLSTNKADIGGVFRDCNGRFLGAFGFSCLHWDSLQVEILSILALRNYIQDWMFDAKGIVIEGDN